MKKQSNETLKYLNVATYGMAGAYLLLTLLLNSKAPIKILNKFCDFTDKSLTFFNNKLQSIFNQKIKEEFNFSKANEHFSTSGINNLGKVSGAHEIRNFIKSLNTINGKILKIEESPTQNNLFEITYKTISDNKMQTDVKTIYIGKEMSTIEKNDFLKLIQYNSLLDLFLLKKYTLNLNKLFSSDSVMDSDKVKSSARKAMTNGIQMRTKSLINDTEKAWKDIQNCEYELKIAGKRKKELQNIIKDIDAKKQIMIKEGKTNCPEFKAIIKDRKKHIDELHNIYSQLGCKPNGIKDPNQKNSLVAKRNNAYKRYLNRFNTFEIYGYNDGKLWGGYAQKENKINALNSYYPLINGSKKQEEFLEALKERKFSFSDLKLYIGASKIQINNYTKKFKTRLKRYIVFCYNTLCTKTLFGVLQALKQINSMENKRENSKAA